MTPSLSKKHGETLGQGQGADPGQLGEPRQEQSPTRHRHVYQVVHPSCLTSTLLHAQRQILVMGYLESERISIFFKVRNKYIF